MFVDLTLTRLSFDAEPSVLFFDSMFLLLAYIIFIELNNPLPFLALTYILSIYLIIRPHESKNRRTYFISNKLNYRCFLTDISIYVFC